RLHLGARLLGPVARQRHRVGLGPVQGPPLRDGGAVGGRQTRGVGTVRRDRAGRRRPGPVVVTGRGFDRTGRHGSVTSGDERSFRTHGRGTGGTPLHT